ncbi:MAG: precorrin-3B C(17)-methyltransferase [Lachnospiraceae bacterium]|jgi:precorrin-3B C17-methyltransferase|nr:precorrin-3B C(17)-methyltransferase [Lachnospiraceae bacterium]
MTKKGRLFVVGIGPGEYEAMTMKAVRTLESCEVIVGYTVYVELIERYFAGRRFLTTPMRRETERCRLAFKEAASGRRVAVICSGDAGVYGMAGLVLELSQEYPDVAVEIVPGVTAALSGAALLGAPLMHDFAVISLSDLLTPWEKIEKRLRAAAEGDFVICLYNPASRKRADYLSRACEILLEYKSPDTVCGVVKRIGREGEERRIMRLDGLDAYEADMFTTVFIGSSRTTEIEGCEDGGQERPFMVTPRGYQI